MANPEDSRQALPQAGSARIYFETLTLLAIAAGAWIYSGSFAGQDPLFRWGPEFWPRVVASALAVLALVQFWDHYQTRRWHQRANAESSLSAGPRAGEENQPERLAWKKLPRLAMTIGLPVIFLLLMTRIGFLFAAPIFIVTMMLHFGVRSILHLTVTATGIYLLFVAVFVKLLGVPLPTGDWPIFQAANIALRGMMGL